MRPTAVIGANVAKEEKTDRCRRERLRSENYAEATVNLNFQGKKKKVWNKQRMNIRELTKDVYRFKNPKHFFYQIVVKTQCRQDASVG